MESLLLKEIGWLIGVDDFCDFEFPISNDVQCVTFLAFSAHVVSSLELPSPYYQMQLLEDLIGQLLEHRYVCQEIHQFVNSALVYIFDDFLVVLFVHHTELAVSAADDGGCPCLGMVQELSFITGLKSLFAECFAFAEN